MRSHSTRQFVSGPLSHRSGVVIVAVIVAISVCLAFAAIWARTVVREQRRMANQKSQMQAMRLAEAGLRRAIALHAADSKYSGETWTVSKSELDNAHDGQVQIRVAPGDDRQSFRYEVTAEFPVGEIRHAQITKSTNLSNSKPAGKL